MSDGNRGKFIEDRGGLILAFLAAGLFVILFVWPAILTQREIQNDASRNAGYYSENAQKDVTTKCSDLSGQARSHCAQPIEDAAREAQRDEYDLSAQKTMALWTAVMGGVAVIGVALSGVGIYLIWRTWRQTIDAADYARRTLRSYIARERALIGIGDALFSYNAEINPPNGFVLKMRNAGTSAARIEKIEWVYPKCATWPEAFPHVHSAVATLASDAPYVSPHLGCEDLSEPLWLIGQVTYTTLETEEFVSPFCFEVTFADGAGVGPEDWIASRAVCEGMPAAT